MDPAHREAEAPVVVAPDGSAVRPLAAVTRGSMATFRLAPGQVAAAVVHRTVDELWFVVSGSGQLWRRAPGNRREVVPEDGSPEAVPNEDGPNEDVPNEDVTVLAASVSVDLPVGTSFQFRASIDGELVIVAVTMPPWPGAGEAGAADGPW